MAGKRFDIPTFQQVKDKTFATPRLGVTIAVSKGGDIAKRIIIQSQVAKSVDLFPDDSYRSAMLGTPVYDVLVIKKEIDTFIGVAPTGEGYATFEAVLVTINQSINIIKTPIQGRSGTVKEYISDGDYEINIRGIVTSQYAERWPREDMENIASLLTLPNEIVLVSDYISLFKIQYAVVESYSFSQVEGSLNQIQMDLKLISDEPVELKLGIDPDA
jgi:hypothetical protein